MFGVLSRKSKEQFLKLQLEIIEKKNEWQYCGLIKLREKKKASLKCYMVYIPFSEENTPPPVSRTIKKQGNTYVK